MIKTCQTCSLRESCNPKEIKEWKKTGDNYDIAIWRVFWRADHNPEGSCPGHRFPLSVISCFIDHF